MTRALMTLDLSCPVGADVDRDDAFVDRLRAGDLAALGEAYDRHHEGVRSFARRFVGDDAAAEDLVQETFVALPRAVRGYRSGSTLRTFLLGIAINHARH